MEFEDRLSELFSTKRMPRSGRAGAVVAAIATSIALFVTASSASAQDGPPETKDPTQTKEGSLANGPTVVKRTGTEFALRSGGAFPMGEAEKDGDLSDLVAWQIPIELNLGYRESESFTYGLYFAYGFGSIGSVVADNCKVGDIKCPVRSLRGGVQFLYHAAPRKPIGGWLSLGIGAESLRAGIESEQANTQFSTSYLGIEFPFQAGLDFRSESGMSVGPYMGFILGRYLDRSNECTGPICSMVPGSNADGMGDAALHVWAMFGIRGSLLL